MRLRAKRISDRELLELPTIVLHRSMRIFIAVDGSEIADRVRESLINAYDNSHHEIVDCVDDCERCLIVPTPGWGKSPAIKDVYRIAKSLKKRVIVMGSMPPLFVEGRTSR